jgi:adenylate cyclase
VVTAINQLFSIVVRSTISHDGVIDKFLGDGALCVFGVPDAGPDDARRAVAMAKEVLLQQEKHNLERRAQGLFELRLGITIHTGEVISGNIGSEERFEYTVIGDPVNTVSRLQDYCKDLKESIILTENVANELGGTFPLRFLKKGTLRGKKEKLDLFTFA